MPVNIVTAHKVMAEVAKLTEMSSIFQARYGKQYRMKPGSPAEAWDLYQSIVNQQTVIARLLDVAALEKPLSRCAQWWKNQDAMDYSITASLAQEVIHLIACCASADVQSHTVASPIIDVSQSVIAGMLHPSSVLVALGDLQAMQRAS
jgi:hypothetical protein